MAYLASEPMGTGATQDIAEQTDVPSAYMAKVFQHLRRGGLVQTQRGVGGGIKLAKSPDKISLLEIIEAVEPLKRPKGPAVASLAILEQTMVAATSTLREQLASTKRGIVKSRVLACCLSGGILQDSIVEDSSLQDERDLLVAGESSPFPGGGLGEFEHHGEAGSAGSAPLGLAMAQSDRGESRLDRIGRPQVLPMLGGEGVERQEFAAIFA